MNFWPEVLFKTTKRQKTISIPARYRYGFGKIEHGEFEIEPLPRGGQGVVIFSK